MSVQGEFRRIAADAVACLRSCSSTEAERLAVTLESERSAATHDLLGAAARVLDLWTNRIGAIEASDSETRARLKDAGERLTQISHVVLGR